MPVRALALIGIFASAGFKLKDLFLKHSLEE
jgi:hypothetical protein